MKKLGLLILCFCFLFVCMTMSVSARQNHFKVYEAKSAEPFKPIVVVLKDQFDKEPMKVKLTSISFFANPVEKKTEKGTYRIPVPNAHLTWYEFKDMRPKKRIVKFKNQFGEQKWMLGEAVFLLVPTQKLRKGSSMPREFNHFKAYKYLEGDFKPIKVLLKDQFDEKHVKVIVKKPLFFCNPVSKNEEPIFNKRYHLACYLIEGEFPGGPKSINIVNQFKENRLYPGGPIMLCVPTEKLGFEVIK